MIVSLNGLIFLRCRDSDKISVGEVYVGLKTNFPLDRSSAMSHRQKAPPLSEFPFQSQQQLRFSDTDAVGHVNNAIFATLFDVLRGRKVGSLELGSRNFFF